MALNYLLSPEFQIVNTAGKPATGGYLEVYISGSRERYYCASDFDGTLYPFHVPLDSLGSNVVLADDSHAYDVYVYNRYGGLLMSRYNVQPRSGGGIGINDITSSDGSIVVTQTANGVDLRTNSTPPSILRATAATLYADGQFVFSEAQRDGQNAIVDSQGKVIVNEGWWHYDATVRLRWNGPAQNETQSVSLYTQNASDSMTVDLSFAHSETVQVSGEYKALNDSTQFVLGVTNVPSGMVVELVDFGVHSIIGEGAGGKYEAGNGIVIDEPNRIISVDFDEVQAKLTAGDGVTIDSDNEISVDTSVIQRALSPGNGISLDSDDNITVKVDRDSITFNGDGELQANFPAQVQSDWTEADSTDPSYIQNKPTNLVQDADYVHTDNNYTDADVAKLSGIAAGAEVNVQSNWTEADTTADSYIQNKPTNLVQDASYVHTDNNFTTSLKDKLDGIASGAEVNVQSDWTEADNTADSYIKNKPAETTLAAGSNITITESGSTLTIAANVPAQQQANWTEADNTDPSYIQNKPTIPPDNVFIATYGTTTYQELSAAHTAGKAIFVVNVSGVLSAIIPMTSFNTSPAMVMFSAVIGSTEYTAKIDQGVWSSTSVSIQADWDEANQLAPSYVANKPTIVTPVNADWDAASGLAEILNKPTEKSLVAGSNITLTEAANSVTIAATVPAQQQADWTEADNTSVSYIQNKPSLATVASSGLYTDLLNTPDLSLKEDVANKAQSINTSSTTDYPSSKATADYVNSSVATNTAKFLGNYSLTDLSLTYPATDAQIETALDGYAFSPAPTNNDYVYVEIQDPLTPGVADVVKRFKYDGTSWLYEYSLNNSSFTAAEIAAIDSGVTATKVNNYDTHIADTTIHVTSTDKTTWNGKQDAISDLNTIRSGAALGATAVQPGDLATVATSGLYSDLSGTPTIPTATSDLQNDSGFITLSDVPAQVNADWNSSSGASEILNKPTIPSGVQLVPAATSADADKVLTVDSQGTPAWSTPAAGGVTDVEVDGTSVVSGGVARITMPTDLVPAVTSSDDSKVLKASYTGGVGSYSWETESGGGTHADWAESDPTDPSYIENKPVPKTIVAGTGISITESSTELTVASTNQLYSAGTGLTLNNATFAVDTSVVATQSDLSGKQDTLTAGANITIDANNEISATDTTYSAGAGIQISNSNVISVEETVLYSGLKSNGDGGSATYTLSELPTNFQIIKVYCCASDNTFPTSQSGNCGMAFFEWDTTMYTPPNTFFPVLMNGNTGTNFTQYWTSANVNGIRTTTWTVQGSLNSATTNAKWFHIYKIVGIHRIASN